MATTRGSWIAIAFFLLAPLFSAVVLSVTARQALAIPNPSGFEIEFILDTGEFAFPDEPEILTALERGGSRWGSFLEDPIKVRVTMQAALLTQSTIGGAFPQLRSLSYTEYRSKLISDTDDDDSIVNYLPSTLSQINASIPSGASVNQSQVSLARPLAEAVGFAADGGIEAAIVINSFWFDNDMFDFDRSDGIDSTKTDFEAVIVHELGHSLGIHSGPFLPNATIRPKAFDLFRFSDDGSGPSTPEEFTDATRDWVSTTAIFSDTSQEFPTTTAGGGHWIDNRDTGQRIGVMDPTLSPGEFMYIMLSDLRTLDLMGYDVIDVMLGDVNLDGMLDFGDSAPFADVVLNGTPDDEVAIRADINQDGVIDDLDVPLFIDLLTGGGGSMASAVPEPATFALAGLALLGLIGYARRK